MLEDENISTSIYKVETIESHTELISKYLIDKLMSYVFFEIENKQIEKKLNQHCYDVFTKKMMDDLIQFEHIAYDKDEFKTKLNIPNAAEPKIFYNQIYHGSNNWGGVLEPV